MEGMILKEILPIQADHIALGHCTLSIDKWDQTLVAKLLKVTHRQWLYRNVHIHNATAVVNATACKEEIQ